jgi:pimeloyl-ACP methyl ester carboxylesterase
MMQATFDPMVRRVSLGILLIVTSVACSDSTAPETESNQQNIVAVRDWSTTLQWEDCAGGLECTTFEVPYDYENPSIGTFILPATRRLADNLSERIGALFINPGGPGVAALDYVAYADQIFSKSIIDRFDIIAWDPRGVGQSDPHIDCVDSMDDYFGLDPSPDDTFETDLLLSGAKSFAENCSDRSAEFLSYVSTVDTASDMDVLRRALNEEQISYLGFSYGTQLGATWATLFPETVRAAVLDAAVDPTRGYVDDLLLQAGGFESSLNAFLTKCNTSLCSFMKVNESAEDAFDRILFSLDQNPISNNGGRTATNQGVAQTGIAGALYSDYQWPQLENALSAADLGDGQPLLILFDEYFSRDSSGFTDDSLDAYFGITCLDRDEQITPDEVLRLKSRLQDIAPRLGAGWIQEMLICAHWDFAPSGDFEVTADTENRIVVVGSTGDAATPLEGTRNMVTALDQARLVISPLEQHTTYGTDQCVTEIVDDYLLNLSDGPDITTCDSGA